MLFTTLKKKKWRAFFCPNFYLNCVIINYDILCRIKVLYPPCKNIFFYCCFDIPPKSPRKRIFGLSKRPLRTFLFLKTEILFVNVCEMHIKGRFARRPCKRRL